MAHVASLGTAARLVARGLGFAWLPEHEITQYLNSQQLKPLPLEQGAQRSAYLFLYANKERPVGPATRILADLIIEHSMTEH